MKVLVGSFMAESNEHVSGLTELNDFSLMFGNDVLDKIMVRETFESAGIELVPSIYASAVGCKKISKEAFDYILKKFLNAVEENIDELDGIYLFLHGASKVDLLEGGSGDRYILQEIRKITGEHFPIAVVMDPHGNLTEEYVSMMSIGRCYRHSPHTDIRETYEHVAKLFIDYLNNKDYIIPLYKKLPLILGGEKSVSTDEPMVTINKKLDDIESDSRIMSASFHIGYIRHDNFSTGTGLIVIPSEAKYREYAENKLNELTTFIISLMEEFEFHGRALELEDTITESLSTTLSHVVVTDSGDNVTSGAEGANTYILRKYLKSSIPSNKKILFAGIYDPISFSLLKDEPIGEIVDIQLGRGNDELEKSVSLKVTVKEKGTLQQIFGDTSTWGETITISIVDKNIDIVLIDKSVSFAENHQFEAAKIELSQYNIVVVKQGYVFPELKEYGNLSIMALTDGQTNQKIETIKFRQVQRPIFPLDSYEKVLSYYEYKKDDNK